MKTCLGSIGILLALSLGRNTVLAADAPAIIPATAPTDATPRARPNSETVGTNISKLTRNQDGTVTATFATVDKQGNTVPRDVLLTENTVVNIGGQMKKLSDVTDDVIKQKVVAMVGPDGKIAVILRFGKAMLTASQDDYTPAQVAALKAAAPKPTAQSDAILEKQADAYVAALNLNSPEREARIRNVLITNLRAVRDAHNAWFNPSKSVREDLNKGLAADLTDQQIDQVKNMLTSNDMEHRLYTYHIIVPGLTVEEDKKITELLLQAREAALDAKDSKDLSAAFNPYKNQIEAYLISKGHDWHALYTENLKKVGETPAVKAPEE